MKGIVFTEFLEMVEQTFGLETVDTIIEEADLPSDGAYTSVGTYDFNEMVQLVGALSEKTKVPVGELLFTFGHYLFDSLVKVHPEVVSAYTNPLGLLYSIEDHIHVQVKKLYPDAELPSFKVLEKSDTKMELVYSSSRGLYPLAHGLMTKTFEHFEKKADIELKLLKEDGTEVQFSITQNG